MNNDGRTRPRKAPGGGLSLVLAVPGGAPRVVALAEPGEHVIGRDPSVAISIADESLSRRHACIRGGETPFLEDLGSTNGTRVQGKSLTSGVRLPLAAGNVIELGDVVGIVRSGAIDEPSVDDAPRSLRGGAPTPNPRGAVVESPAMQEVYRLLPLIAPSRLSVLILGETGSGKDVFAEAVHHSSERAEKPFLRINCAALPENLLEAELFGYERGAFTGAVQAKPGLLESADGGTVFLDEIGELSLATQAKFLRVLESREVMRVGGLKSRVIDVRFVFATHRDLEARATTGEFREDLFYRVNGVSVYLPPLRERSEDILPLARHFAKTSAGREVSFDPQASAALVNHVWPGNVRELRNVVERAVLLSRGATVARDHIQLSTRGLGARTPASTPELRAHATSIASGTDDERTRIEAALNECSGNQTRAAKLLGMSRSTLVRRLEELGFSRPRK